LHGDCTRDGIISAEESPEALIGARVGNYELSSILGHGGMGTIYFGRHRVIESRVAVKILHRSFSTTARVVKRFFSEARAVNLINHENIVKIFDLGVTEDGRYYFVMEYLDGRTLAEVLDDGPMPWSQACALVSQIADGLEAAHQAGIVHRDLKPANIMIVEHHEEQNVKILDYGVAKLHDRKIDPNTEAGALLGTPHYMSPEQASGEKVDHRTDLYALGVILYRIVTGRIPFEAESLRQLLLLHILHEPPRPSSINPDVSPALEAVIVKALAKDPNDRFRSARDLKSALEEASASMRPESAPIPLSPNPRAERLIERLCPLLSKDHYAFLGVPRSSAAWTIRQAARRLTSELCLEALGPMPPDQSEKIAEIRKRVTNTLNALVSPRSRAVYDASLGNYEGVAQAITSGLSEGDISALRAHHLAKNPKAERTAATALREALAALDIGQIDDARAALERALAADPFERTLHERHASLRRRIDNPRVQSPRRIREKRAT
jgi:serine/threonine protein kinase